MSRFFSSRRKASGRVLEQNSANNSSDDLHLLLSETPDPRMASSSRSSLLDHEGSLHASDLQLQARVAALEKSLRKPNLSPTVRVMLEAALHQFERDAEQTKELLPPYSKDMRPPYVE